MADSDTTYDYIIIGAGSAGCVVANRLSADAKVRVLLLEAGHKGEGFWYRVPIGLGKLVDNPKACWMYETEPREGTGNRRISWPRGKSLGGSSAINGMLYVRGLAYDYDLWRQLGNTGWSYEDVLPYFRKSQHQVRGGDDYNGSDGPLTVSDVEMRDPLSDAMFEAIKNNGVPVNEDFNGAEQEGVGYYQQTTKNGQRASTAKAFLDPIRWRKSLTIQINAHTNKILFDGKRATGVAYRQGRHERTANARREVIVCAGAISSPQILQLSGIGPGALLQSFDIPVMHDAPAVGQNLQDHYQVSSINGLKDNLGANLALSSPPRMLLTGLKYLLRRKGWMAFAAAQIGVFTKSDPNMELPDLQFHYVPYSTSGIGKALHTAPAFTLSMYQQRPESRGSLAIKTPDPADTPTIDPNYLGTQFDIDTTLAGFKLGRQFCATEPIAGLIDKEWAPGKKAVTDDEVINYMRNYGGTAYHPTSTCMMGPGDNAVVDDQLRVKGVQSLRVADASIMPNMVSGNTNAASIMIGEKAADLILAASN
jgi:choline dehydrogenase